MVKPILYYAPRSAPSRSVLLIAKALDIVLELKHVFTDKGDNKTPAFLKVRQLIFLYIFLARIIVK